MEPFDPNRYGGNHSFFRSSLLQRAWSRVEQFNEILLEMDLKVESTVLAKIWVRLSTPVVSRSNYSSSEGGKIHTSLEAG